MEFDPEYWVGVIGAVCLIANAISAAFPTRSKTPWIAFVLRVINVLAVNIGKNKNADDVEDSDPMEEIQDAK